jgi:hypothetical protein
MEAYQGGGFFLCVRGKEKKKMRKCEEGFLVLMCGEMFMEHVCARIKHGRKLCFVASTCSSQIHRWICVKF